MCKNLSFFEHRAVKLHQPVVEGLDTGQFQVVAHIQPFQGVVAAVQPLQLRIAGQVQPRQPVALAVQIHQFAAAADLQGRQGVGGAVEILQPGVGAQVQRRPPPRRPGWRGRSARHGTPRPENGPRRWAPQPRRQRRRRAAASPPPAGRPARRRTLVGFVASRYAYMYTGDFLTDTGYCTINFGIIHVFTRKLLGKSLETIPSFSNISAGAGQPARKGVESPYQPPMKRRSKI